MMHCAAISKDVHMLTAGDVCLDTDLHTATDTSLMFLLPVYE
jgi:hypothetical protein